MAGERAETIPIRSQDDVVRARQTVRLWAAQLGFGIVDQTKVVTAASELARNTLVHGGGGAMRLAIVEKDGRQGLHVVFEDEGPGIPDMGLALTDGYTTGEGLGLGLSGARRLVGDLEIQSEVGVGTRVSLTKWK
jgi:serine/threonine-protein kinase RsbT